MIVNAASIAAIFVNLRAEFNRIFEKTEVAWDRVATLIPSSTGTETYNWLGRFPKMREWIGEKFIKSLEAYSYSLKNKDFEATVEVDRNDIADDTLGIYGPQAQNAGKSAKEWPDDLVMPLLKAGTSNLCFDGQNFFDTDHLVAGASVSNYGGGSSYMWVLLDTSWPLKPLIFQQREAPNFVLQTDPQSDAVFLQKKFRFGAESRGNAGYGFWQMAYASKATLDAAALNAAIKAMELFKDEQGETLKVKPNLLVVCPSLRATARDLIQAEKLASGASNTLFKALDLMVTPHLE